MAQPSTIYRVTIQLSDVDKGVYEALQATVARHPSETEERLVARLLAYLLFYDDALVFTKGVAAGDEPDLWQKGADDRVLLWVEVGLPESDRLVKASRHAAQVALVACGKNALLWEAQQSVKLEKVPNLSIVRVDYEFIRNLASRLDRVIRWDVTITDNTIYIQLGSETFESHLQISGSGR